MATTVASLLSKKLDTGSSLIWLQCKPCNPCFPQNRPAFDPTTSSTYNALPCNHIFCQGPQYSCVNNQCNYTLSYVDTSTSKGVLSNESFSFLSDGSIETLNDVIFGCGYNNVQPHLEGDIDGVLGMNIGKLSLLAQMKDRVNSRFSYCLIPINAEPSGQSSFLRFGDDIVIQPRSRVQTTPFYMYNGNPHMYSVNLLDISVEDVWNGSGRHRTRYVYIET
ncbi:hypothetical protein C5167_051079 [Papaver somniferum]|uniref:Peptidase A1 domain-containing protein n=1 Tax=Papaver somniferum TaxID=3469 RepID=A0A4Y7KRX0_PAPSO|nr:hypothetical protein C5167_051079 [Papaver somniferum]